MQAPVYLYGDYGNGTESIKSFLHKQGVEYRFHHVAQLEIEGLGNSENVPPVVVAGNGDKTTLFISAKAIKAKIKQIKECSEVSIGFRHSGSENF